MGNKVQKADGDKNLTRVRTLIKPTVTKRKISDLKKMNRKKLFSSNFHIYVVTPHLEDFFSELLTKIHRTNSIGNNISLPEIAFCPFHPIYPSLSNICPLQQMYSQIELSTKIKAENALSRKKIDYTDIRFNELDSFSLFQMNRSAFSSGEYSLDNSIQLIEEEHYRTSKGFNEISNDLVVRNREGTVNQGSLAIDTKIDLSEVVGISKGENKPSERGRTSSLKKYSTVKLKASPRNFAELESVKRKIGVEPDQRVVKKIKIDMRIFRKEVYCKTEVSEAVSLELTRETA